jgi:hypothetical protein
METSLGPPVGPRAVLNLLGEQAALYGRLEALAARQQVLVSTEQIGPLIQVLADRQRLSDELVRIGTRLAPLRRDWASYRNQLTEVEREEAEQLWKDARDRLRSVIESDERDARVLSGRKQTVAATLRSTQSNSHALSAYRGHGEASVRIDCVDQDD